MKHLTILLTIATFLIASLSVNGQIIDPKKEAKNQGTNRTNNKIESGISSGFDKLEDGIGSLFNKRKKNKKEKKSDNSSTNNQSSSANENNSSESSSSNNSSTNVEAKAAKPAMDVKWSKFDFVPGDEVIFEDQPHISEENGEFPSRWDLQSGQVEVMTVNGENVIGYIDGTPSIIPFIKNSDQDYLPEVFTVEFDIYRPAEGNRFTLYLYDRKNQKYMDNGEIEINLNRADIGDIVSEYESGKNNEEGNWIHVSVAFTKGKLKVYLDETRLLNIPHYQGNPTGLTFQAYWADAGENKTWFMKNIRIAKGGVKYYDRVLNDGKIICNGIRFDTNKSTLKPESMGPINKIYNLMQKQPDLKFSVEGHTDSDGDNDRNQTLSEQRAKAVVEKLTELGIARERFEFKGFGETMPVDNNTSAEGKANNRRVEFVKI